MTKIFSWGRIVLSIGWAKSLLWCHTDNDEQRTYFVAFYIIKRKNDSALSVILGPVALVIGVVI